MVKGRNIPNWLSGKRVFLLAALLFLATFSTLQFAGGLGGRTVFADNVCPPNSTTPRCTGGNPPGTPGGGGNNLPTTTPTCPGGTTYVDLYNSCLGPKVNGACPAGTSEVNYVPPPNNCGVNPNAPSSTKQAPTCENVSEDDGWLICPIFNGVSNFTDWMYSNFLQPFLYTAPISTSANDSSFKVWSTFRVYGDIFLVAAILIIVFGEALGGGLLDAYTAKKALPRVLAAAILINLSVYIVAGMVDLTNVLGGTIGHVITAPIDLSFQPSKTAGDVAIAGGVIGLIFSAGGILTVMAGLFALKASFIKSALWVAFFALLPIFLAILLIFILLVLRKGLILALVLISPVAFALYCLPATERWFRRWWGLLFKTLLVYPAVAVVYAVADVLSVTILKANGVTADSVKSGAVFTGAHSLGHALPHLATILTPGHTFAAADATTGGGVGIVIIAFLTAVSVEAVGKGGGVVVVVREGGEALGAAHNWGKGAAAKLNGMADSRRELHKRRFQGQMIQAREKAYRGAGKLSNSGNGLVRFLGRRLQNQVQGGGLRDVLAEHANYRADEHKKLEALNATGDDTQIRALTVNKKWALEQGTEATAANGWQGDWRRNANGGREFRTLAGNKWVSEGDVDAAYTRWGNNQSALQWSLGHEMDKASTLEDQNYLKEHYMNLNYQGKNGDPLGTGQGWKMNDAEMGAAWTGAGFAKQNANREWKHYKVKNGQLHFDRMSAIREADEKKSSYELGQTNADYWTSLTRGMQLARDRHDKLTVKSRTTTLTTEEQAQLRDDKEYLGRASRIAGRLKASGAMYSGAGGVNGQGNPVPAGTGKPGEASVGAGAVSRTGEEMVLFTRAAETLAPEYDVDNVENATIKATPKWANDVPNPTSPIPAQRRPDQAAYGYVPGTENAVDNRSARGVNRGGEGQ